MYVRYANVEADGMYIFMLVSYIHQKHFDINKDEKHFKDAEKKGFSLPSSCTFLGMSVFGFCSSQRKYTLESSSSHFIG